MILNIKNIILIYIKKKNTLQNTSLGRQSTSAKSLLPIIQNLGSFWWRLYDFHHRNKNFVMHNLERDRSVLPSCLLDWLTSLWLYTLRPQIIASFSGVHAPNPHRRLPSFHLFLVFKFSLFIQLLNKFCSLFHIYFSSYYVLCVF